ncbi:hypothetical protein [Stutzerimonas stutzeri]|uniref:hypothetical protein n=1 Tax=Stutzerimonas stutzeri TaxID=316 RepID=UPI0015E3389F|nr:hypothetical protein [Stutzerimonas stutzeri]MBA1264986.1 glycosyltransferase family 9 protein [Stutzerimonas stutzeri]
MRCFALPQDRLLDASLYRRRYRGGSDPQALPMECLYLDVGGEAHLLKKLPQDEGWRSGLLPGKAEPEETNQAPGLHLIEESSLLAWPYFPVRLGRMSASVGQGLRLHLEDEPLPRQLQALRARKPDKQHLRLAIVNGFGTNLGDCTIGITAFRAVLNCLREHLPSLSCDILFGPGTSAATADILQDAPEIERVLFHALTVTEFAQYDAYFDFTHFIRQPRYNELPTVDWVLWWCGLAPQNVPPEHKRNRGHIRQDAWQAVRQHLQAHPGQKVLFNPKASVALRTMPPRVAADFAWQLLQLAPEITLVVDQPLDCQHPRLLDVSAHIDCPERFRALVVQMDGLVTVNSLASHVADIGAVPTVHLCVTVPGHFYPYYPFTAALNPDGYEALPAFGRVKVEAEEWEVMREQYEAAWARISPLQVLTLLREKMAQRQTAIAEPAGLSIGVGHKPARSVVLDDNGVPRLKRQRLAPLHAYASERFAHLSQSLLKPGAVCVMACAPDAGLAQTLARRVAPHGELIVLEPRAPLARNVEAALHLAGTGCIARVLQAVPLAGAAQVQINLLEPWSESLSTQWGNQPSLVTVPCQTVDQLALEHCDALFVQSPMPFVPFIDGALETLKRCRPIFLMTSVDREQALAVCQAARQADYAFWVEAAVPNTPREAGNWLLVGAPQERPVQIEGFARLKLD